MRRKNSWCLGVAFLLFVFELIAFVSAQYINLEYPEEVAVGEEFSIKIKLNEFGDEGKHDIKIDITEKEDRIAQILDKGNWKSTFFYVNTIMSNNKEKSFTLKIIKDFEEADLIVKVRDSKEKVITFNGYKIKNIDRLDKTKEEQKKEIGEEKVERIGKTKEKEGSIITGATIEGGEKEQQVKTIKLTKDIKTQKDKELELDKQDYTLYGFVVFCILLVILFLIRRKI